MKRRMSPIWAVVETNSNAVGLTDVVRRSRTAVSAAGRMGHSSSNPSTLVQGGHVEHSEHVRGDDGPCEVAPGQRAGQYSRPRLQRHAAASDASGGVSGRD
jgi:hypothetical protein